MAKYGKGSVSELTVSAFTGLNTESSKNGSMCEATYMRNFTVSADGALVKRYGYKKLLSGLEYESWYLGRVKDTECFIYKNGTMLYAVDPFTAVTIATHDSGTYDDVGFFLFGGNVYAFGGDCFVSFNGTKFSEPDIYVPTVLITASPEGAGYSHESLNLLSEFAKVSYSPDGTSTVYKLPDAACEVISVEDETGELDVSAYSYDEDDNALTFTVAPQGGVPDSLKVTFMLKDEYIFNPKRFGKNFCVYGGDFDSRVFIYGVGNRIYYTDITSNGPDVTYIPAENFITVGDGTWDVTMLLTHYDRLIVFTEGETWYVSVEYTDIAGYRRPSFPVYPLNSRIGSARGAAALIDNYPVTLHKGRLYRFSNTSIRDERAAKCISDRVDSLFGECSTEGAILFDNEEKRELWCAFEGTVYIYNYRDDTFYCYDGINAEGFAVLSGEAAFVYDGSLYTFSPDTYNDDGKEYTAIWESRFFLPTGKYRKCRLRRVSLSLLPEPSTRLTVRIIPNRGRETVFGEELTSSVFDFGSIDFSNFSFDTERKPKSNRKRLRSDEFEYLRVRFENGSAYTRAAIRGIDMKLETV